MHALSTMVSLYSISGYFSCTCHQDMHLAHLPLMCTSAQSRYINNHHQVVRQAHSLILSRPHVSSVMALSNPQACSIPLCSI